MNFPLQSYFDYNVFPSSTISPDFRQQRRNKKLCIKTTKPETVDIRDSRESLMIIPLDMLAEEHDTVSGALTVLQLIMLKTNLFLALSH